MNRTSKRQPVRARALRHADARNQDLIRFEIWKARQRACACGVPACVDARAQADRVPVLVRLVADLRVDLQGTRDAAFAHDRTVQTILVQTTRERDAAAADVVKERALHADTRLRLEAVADALKGQNAGLRDRVDALEVKVQATGEALDAAAEALGKGAEENQQLRALLDYSQEQHGATLKEKFALRDDLQAALAQIAKLETEPLRFLPVEGRTLPNGDWVFRLPKPRYGNLLARRLGHIRAARVRAGLRMEGEADSKKALLLAAAPLSFATGALLAGASGKPTAQARPTTQPQGFPGYQQGGH